MGVKQTKATGGSMGGALVYTRTRRRTCANCGSDLVAVFGAVKCSQSGCTYVPPPRKKTVAEKQAAAARKKRAKREKRRRDEIIAKVKASEKAS